MVSKSQTLTFFGNFGCSSQGRRYNTELDVQNSVLAVRLLKQACALMRELVEARPGLLIASLRDLLKLEQNFYLLCSPESQTLVR